MHQQRVDESEDELPKSREESRVKFADVKMKESEAERVSIFFETFRKKIGYGEIDFFASLIELIFSKFYETFKEKFATICRHYSIFQSDNEQTSSATTTPALRPRDLQLVPFLNKSQPSPRKGVQFIEPASSRKSKMDIGETVSVIIF